MGCVRVFSESPSAEWVIVGVMMCVWMGRSFTETPTKCSSPSSAVAHSNPTSSSEKEWVGRQWKGVGNSVSVKYHENRCVFELYTGEEMGVPPLNTIIVCSRSYTMRSHCNSRQESVLLVARALSLFLLLVSRVWWFGNFYMVDDEMTQNKTRTLRRNPYVLKIIASKSWMNLQ